MRKASEIQADLRAWADGALSLGETMDVTIRLVRDVPDLFKAAVDLRKQYRRTLEAIQVHAVDCGVEATIDSGLLKRTRQLEE